MDQRARGVLATRSVARRAVVSAARPRSRDRASNVVGARLRLRPGDHGAQRAGRAAQGRPRLVRPMAVLRVDLRQPGRRRAVGLADRRPSPRHQHGRVRRSHRDHAGLHGLRAALDRGPVVVRPRGGGRPGLDAVARRRAARQSADLLVDHEGRHAGSGPAEPVRREAGGRHGSGQPRRPLPGCPGQ